MEKEEVNRILRFCVVGFSNFVIISLTVWVMMHLLDKTVYVSNVVAYTLAIASSFVWNGVQVTARQGGTRDNALSDGFRMRLRPAIRVSLLYGGIGRT